MYTEDTPVAIVGAGPVGLALALGLARHGIAAVVLEKERALCPESRAPGVLPRTLGIFEHWGLLDDLRRRGTYRDRLEVYRADDDARLFSLDLGAALAEEAPVPGVLFVPQDQTVATIAAALERYPSTRLRLGHPVVSVAQDGRRARLRVEPLDGAPYELRARYVVGCDGAHSVVRAKLGWPLVGKTYASRLLLADVSLPEAVADRPWPRMAPAAPDGLAVAIRLAGNVHRIVATLGADETEAAATSDASIARRVRALFGAAPFHRVWASTFHIHCRTAPRFRFRRILLAGDAAHLNSPVGGQGMNSGIQDAHNLAWKLARVLRGGDASALLRSYDRERRAAVVGVVDRVTDRMTRWVLQSSPRMRLLVLRVASRLVRAPSVAKRLARALGMLETRYPRTSPAVFGRHPLAGRLLPAATFVGEGGRPVRLSELAGPDALLLVFAGGEARLGRSELLRLARPIEELRVLFVGPVPLAPAWDLEDRDGHATKQLGAQPGLVVLVRPDGYVGWARVRPGRRALKRALSHVLGVRWRPHPTRQPLAAVPRHA